MTAPTAMAIAPDGALLPDGRIFVAQQGGALRVIKNGALLPMPFVTLTVDPNGERGLLGIAFDPAFDADVLGPDFVYVYYTVPGSPPHNRVSRFTASGDEAVAGSEAQILNLENLGATNHNGGAIHFGPGPDAKLFVAVGENAVEGNSQVLTNRLGKMLRINKDGTIPPDNPYVDETDGPNEAIWAIGLRNPFTFAFQPGTWRMFINDVGSGGPSAWEEINDGIAHSNYGWPDSEGPTANPLHRSPLFAYQHGLTPGTCAITGGTFYNPPTAQFPPDYVGDYLFADLCAGWIRRIHPADASPSATDFATGVGAPVDLAVANDGSMYYLARSSNTQGFSGSLYRITGPPTVVLAHSFRARRSPAGVILTWRAEPNLRVLGFNVYRAGVRLNRRLIAAGMQGRYRFVDRGATPAGRYRLQAVFADGTRVWIAYSR